MRFVGVQVASPYNSINIAVAWKYSGFKWKKSEFEVDFEMQQP